MPLRLSILAWLPLPSFHWLLLRVAALVAGVAISAGSARADIYGYIDEQGMGHFSTEKIDERYQLFLKGDQSFDSTDLNSETAANHDSTALKTPLRRFLIRHPNLKKFEPLMVQAAHEFSVDVALLKAVMAAESGFNPAAISPKGAVGLMQIMPATAERFGLRGDRKRSVAEKLADPSTNIRLGARYLRELMRLYPASLDLVIASYNAGEGAVQKYRNRIPPYPETRNYVQVVNQFYQIYKPAATLVHNADTAPRRVTMTIPGRRSMPESSGQ